MFSTLDFYSFSIEEESQKGRYRQLEILMLDDNQISDVNALASLAGLRRLALNAI